jgi:opacity protein-like surface antigen
VVLGVEADASAVGADGTNTCRASSGFMISANCRVSQTFAGSIAARAGYALADSRVLLYAKGGFAASHQDVEITTNGLFPPRETRGNTTRIGWLAGAGVERALTPAWSLKVEYDYMDFGTDKVATPDSFRQVIPGANAYVAVPGATTDARHAMHAVKVGVNPGSAKILMRRGDHPRPSMSCGARSSRTASVPTSRSGRVPGTALAAIRRILVASISRRTYSCRG